jgi:Tfp pilus assembly protein FimT
MKAKWKSSKGLTLVEILLAIAILAYVILGLAGMFNYITRATRANEFATLATSYARERMEDIKNRSFDSIPQGTWTVDQSALGQSGKMLFTRQVSVDYMDIMAGSLIVSGTPTDLKRVTVTVIWYERNGNKQVVLTSLISRHS